MVGCRSYCVGEECAPGQEKGELCGSPQCVALGDLSDETYGEG